MTSPQPYPVIQPRTVTPGLKNQNALYGIPEAGVYCRPDWVRLVGPQSMAKWLYRFLIRNFGPADKKTQGAAFFEMGRFWYLGIQMSEGHSTGVVMIDIQGKFCASHDPNEVLQMVDEIFGHGFHATRIDLAVDWVGQDIKLYSNALASCKASELCKTKSYQVGSEYTTEQQAKKLLLYLGKRTSAMCARIYDKGLESGLAPQGWWERLEVEFKEDRAQTIVHALLKEPDRWHEVLWERVVGAIDFRIKNERSELNRRPQSQWWEELIGNTTPKPTVSVNPDTDYSMYRGWFRKSVGPRLLQLAEIFDLEPAIYLEELLQDVKPARSETPAVANARSLSKKIMGNRH